MKVEINIEAPKRFDIGFASHYCPAEWVAILITELQEYNLPMSEEYDMGLHTFGECIGMEYKDQLVYVLSQYKDIPEFIRDFNVIMYLFNKVSF